MGLLGPKHLLCWPAGWLPSSGGRLCGSPAGCAPGLGQRAKLLNVLGSRETQGRELHQRSGSGAGRASALWVSCLSACCLPGPILT